AIFFMQKHLQSYYDYLLIERKFSLHTVNAYLNDVEAFLNYVSKEVVSLNQIKYLHIRNWMMALSTENISNSTINRKIASLKNYFKFLIVTNTIEHYPLQGHKSLRVKKVLQVPFSEN